MKKMKKIPHLVQYQGSKRTLAPKILNCMPHSFGRLIEPFAGSAAVTIACASEKKAAHFLVNDLNEPLINFRELQDLVKKVLKSLLTQTL